MLDHCHTVMTYWDTLKLLITPVIFLLMSAFMFFFRTVVVRQSGGSSIFVTYLSKVGHITLCNSWAESDTESVPENR